MSAQASTLRRHAPCRSTAQHVARHEVPQITRATPQGVVTPRTSMRCSDAASSTRPADAPVAHSQPNSIRFESHVPCGSRARVRGLVRGLEQALAPAPRKGAHRASRAAQTSTARLATRPRRRAARGSAGAVDARLRWRATEALDLEPRSPHADRFVDAAGAGARDRAIVAHLRLRSAQCWTRGTL